MYREDYLTLAEAAKKKVVFLKNNPAGYFVSSMLAGIYVGFAMLFIYIIGGNLDGAGISKVIMGASFPVALSLVLMAGSELFTGNNMAMTAGVLEKKVKTKDALYLWFVCYLGNFAGSILLAVIFCSGGYATGKVGVFLAEGALSKMSHGPLELFCRGILCNILVCAAVWCFYKLKTESGKLIMIFWCIFAFITSGYEHSVANMTLFTAALISPNGVAVTPALAFHNLLFVTLGNIVGGVVFLGVAYYIISKEPGKKA